MLVKKILVLCLLISGLLISAQSTDSQSKELLQSIAFEVSPSFDLPIGKSRDYFGVGGALNIAAELGIIEDPLIYVSGGLVYNIDAIDAAQSISIFSASLGGGAYMDFTPRLSIKGAATVGLYYGFFNQNPSGSESKVLPSFAVGLGLYYLMYPAISLGFDLSYKNYLGLYNGFSVSIGTSIYLKGQSKREAKLQSVRIPYLPEYLQNARQPAENEGLRVDEISFGELFPVFHKYYDENPIGMIRLVNQENQQVTDIKVSVYIKQYMDTPKVCNEPFIMQPGQQEELGLFALLTDQVLQNTEATKVAAEIILEYKIDGDWYRDLRSESLRVHDRNAMTWDDNRKAAAFVTAKDPMVLSVSKFISGIVRARANSALNLNLQKAMGIHEALALYGINYVIDPQTPYIKFSETADQVDYLQFPRQTLEYHAGDCDDLSILYSAMLESVGVETAFITVPGHIFMAFSTGVHEKDAGKLLFTPEDVVVYKDTVWIPIETTEREGDLLQAWKAGAKKWREHSASGKAEFIPIHEAWKLFEPVGSPGDEFPLDIPTQQNLIDRYDQVAQRFIDDQIFPKITQLEIEINRQGQNMTKKNRLGILYAQYGMLDKAREVFEEILEQQEYVPALVNLGNLFYMSKDWDEALSYFEKADRIRPDNPSILVSLARVHYYLENYGFAKRLHEKVQDIDENLAGQYAYLGSQETEEARAASSDQAREGVIWEE